MIRLVILTCLAIVTMVSLHSCRTKEFPSCLDTIEAYMNEYPDSALVALLGIDENMIHGKAGKNHYNLLLAQAKDKCFIDETDDSVMLSVVDYYSKVKDKEKLFKANYYLGRIRQNAGRYTDALSSYLDAGQLAEHVDDDFQKGLLYAQFGILYESQMDLPRALSSYETASEYYSKAGSQPHHYFITNDIGRINFRMGRYSVAEESLHEVMEWAYQSGNEYLTGNAVDQLCMLYEATGEYRNMDDLLGSRYAVFYSDILSRNLSLAYSYARDNKPGLMQEALDAAWNHAMSPNDTASLYYKEYQVFKLLGEDNKALSSHEKLLAIQDSLVRNALQQPLQYAQTEYFKAKASYAGLQARTMRIIFLLFISLLSIILCSVVVFFKRNIERKRMEMERYMEQVAELKSELYNKSSESAALSSMNDDKDEAIRGMKADISVLFSRQYRLLDKLCSVYYETHENSEDMDAIYKKVKAEIERFCNDNKFYRELESVVNAYTDGAVRLLRTELPYLSEMDFRLLCFLLAGFSAKAISVFTGESTGNVYVKKSRLKAEIQSHAYAISPQIMSLLM